MVFYEFFSDFRVITDFQSTTKSPAPLKLFGYLLEITWRCFESIFRKIEGFFLYAPSPSHNINKVKPHSTRIIMISGALFVKYGPIRNLSLRLSVLVLTATKIKRSLLSPLLTILVHCFKMALSNGPSGYTKSRTIFRNACQKNGVIQK